MEKIRADPEPATRSRPVDSNPIRSVSDGANDGCPKLSAKVHPRTSISAGKPQRKRPSVRAYGMTSRRRLKCCQSTADP